MIIYLICFALSCALLKLSAKIKKDNLLHKITTFIALLIPCILAGCRATTIGTDIKVYVEPIFNCAILAENILDFFSMGISNFRDITDFEYGFTTFIYLFAKATNSLPVILFFIEVLIVFPIYFGLRKFKIIEKDIWFGMLIFYLMFFPITLNAMRQYISIAIIFYGTSCLINEKKGYGKAIVALALAYLFHKTALIGIFIYIIYYVLNYQYKKNKIIKISNHIININKIITLSIIFVGFVLIMNLEIVENLFNSIEGLERYNSYISKNVALDTFSTKVIPIVILFMLVWKNFIKQNKDAWFYILLFVLSYFVIVQLASANEFASRISYMFEMFNIVSFTILCNSFTKIGNRQIAKLILILYLIFYWWLLFVNYGYNQTVPYIPFWNEHTFG